MNLTNVIEKSKINIYNNIKTLLEHKDIQPEELIQKVEWTISNDKNMVDNAGKLMEWAKGYNQTIFELGELISPTLFDIIVDLKDELERIGLVAYDVEDMFDCFNKVEWTKRLVSDAIISAEWREGNEEFVVLCGDDIIANDLDEESAYAIEFALKKYEEQAVQS